MTDDNETPPTSRTIINIGVGVNSTAILALIKARKLIYENSRAVFADTGAEKPATYAYLEYLKTVSPIPIEIVKSEEGSLFDYCDKKAILPMRHLRWCSDRWKKVPLNKNRGEKDKVIIGIDYGEKHRARRWINDGTVSFPLIDLQMDRKACIEAIKAVGWEVPEKSGCFFCPYTPLSEFAELKTKNPLLFDKVCEIEKRTLARLKEMRMDGWYGSKPLAELVAMKHPETVEGQMCLYCVDW